MVAAKVNAVRVIEVERQDGSRFNLTIPDTAKITFAQLNPGSKDHYSSGGPVLRIYEGTQNNQRALFRDIKSFRDTSYKLVEIVIEVEEEFSSTHDSNGNLNESRSRKVSEPRRLN